VSLGHRDMAINETREVHSSVDRGGSGCNGVWEISLGVSGVRTGV